MCNVPLCKECIKNLTHGPHASHTLDDIEEALAKLDQLFGRLQQKMKTLSKNNRKTFDRIENKISVCEEKCVAETEQQADKVIAEVAEWKHNNLKKIHMTAARARLSFQHQVGVVTQIQERLDITVNDVSESLKNRDLAASKKYLEQFQSSLEVYEGNLPTKHNISLGYVPKGYQLELNEFKADVSTFSVQGTLI